MSIRDANKNRVLANGSTYSDRAKNNLINLISHEFTSSPSYYQVYINNAQTATGVQITDENSLQKNPNKKRILMKPGEAINVGDTVVWNGNYWLCTDNDPDNGIYVSGIIERCNNELKWLNSSGGTITAPCISTNKSLYTTGIDENKYMTIGAGHINVVAPANSDTLTLQRDKRFLLGYQGRYDCWKTTMVDATSQPGVVMMVMDYDEKQPQDDLTNGIAYNGEIQQTTTDVYTISILNNTNIILNPWSTWQIKWEVRKNGEIVNEPLTFTTNNGGIVTVDSNGLCTTTSSYGSATITVKVSEHPSVYAVVNISTSNVSHNYTVDILGNSILYPGDMLEYVAEVRDKGVITNGNIIWSINYNGNPETISDANFNNHIATISVNNRGIVGTIYLIAKYASDTSKVFTKIIDIREKNFW